MGDDRLGPLTPIEARRNLLDLMYALGGVTATDRAWLRAHPLQDPP